MNTTRKTLLIGSALLGIVTLTGGAVAANAAAPTAETHHHSVAPHRAGHGADDVLHHVAAHSTAPTPTPTPTTPTPATPTPTPTAHDAGDDNGTDNGTSAVDNHGGRAASTDDNDNDRHGGHTGSDDSGHRGSGHDDSGSDDSGSDDSGHHGSDD